MYEAAHSRDARPRPIGETARALRAFHTTGATQPYAFRAEQLRTFSRALDDHEAALLKALHADLGKPPIEAYTAEIGLVQSDIAHALRRLRRWMRPRRVRGPLLAWPSWGAVWPEPYGAALIIGPWNYPVHLLLSPLVGAIAAGNCACLKPSELAPETSHALAAMVRDAFPPEFVTVAEGGREATEELLAQRFDFIFFTGSARVGHRVLEAAAKTLTPATLELGGKSPCIVCRDAPIETAARRILWGKCLNAGQTCIAPDYVLADDRILPQLVEAFGRTLAAFYPRGARNSPDYGRIVNRAHFDRLAAYLETGRIAVGGAHDAGDLFIEPTVLTDLPPDAPALREEIFGPILPVLPFATLDDAIMAVRERPTPLAVYAFTRDRETQRRLQREIASGGVCFNDTVSHALAKNLPFGGLGESGMGAYHGRASFDCFTHSRSVLRRACWPDVPLRYPPLRASLRTIRKAYRLLLRF